MVSGIETNHRDQPAMRPAPVLKAAILAIATFERILAARLSCSPGGTVTIGDHQYTQLQMYAVWRNQTYLTNLTQSACVSYGCTTGDACKRFVEPENGDTIIANLPPDSWLVCTAYRMMHPEVSASCT